MLARSFVLAALASTAMADLTVNTISSLIECQPALISWNGGTPPYFLAVIPGGDPSAAALENFPQQTGTSFTWKVDQPEGTSVTIKITDSTGETNYNQKVTIQKGSDNSCVGSGGNSTTSSSSDAAATPAGSSGAAAASSGAAAGPSGAATQANAAAGSGASGASNAATSASKSASTPVSASASGSAAASTSGAALPLAVTDKATGLVAILGAMAAFFL